MPLSDSRDAVDAMAACGQVRHASQPGPPGASSGIGADESLRLPGACGPAEVSAARGVDAFGAEAGRVSGYRDKECFAVFG